MKVVFALGDSLTYGAWDKEGLGWTTLLRSYLDSIEPYPSYYLYSLGIPGETSDGLAKRYLSEIEARKRSDDDSYSFVLACGANDATWLTKQSRFKTTTEEYRDNMSLVIDELLKRSSDVRVVNITPLNEKYSREFRGKDKSCLNEYADKYNSVLQEVCSKTSAMLIDVNTAFKAQNTNELLTIDGLHPNSKGHKLILETLKAANGTNW